MITNKKHLIQLPGLPYEENALAPYISSRTLHFHHGKHHKGYIDKLNTLVEDTLFENESLESILRNTANKPGKKDIFNNAAQAWNHAFYWKSMRPQGGGKPRGEMARHLEEAFGSFDRFKNKFSQAAAAQFGSGWVWLVLDNGSLQVTQTHDADTPLVNGQKPLLAMDVWEHAYYLDYQNRRNDYATAYVEHLIDWDFASQNLYEVSEKMKRHKGQ